MVLTEAAKALIDALCPDQTTEMYFSIITPAIRRADYFDRCVLDVEDITAGMFHRVFANTPKFGMDAAARTLIAEGR